MLAWCERILLFFVNDNIIIILLSVEVAAPAEGDVGKADQESAGGVCFHDDDNDSERDANANDADESNYEYDDYDDERERIGHARAHQRCCDVDDYSGNRASSVVVVVVFVVVVVVGSDQGVDGRCVVLRVDSRAAATHRHTAAGVVERCKFNLPKLLLFF